MKREEREEGETGGRREGKGGCLEFSIKCNNIFQKAKASHNSHYQKKKVLTSPVEEGSVGMENEIFVYFTKKNLLHIADSPT